METETTVQNNELKTFLATIPAGDVAEFTWELINVCKSNRVIFRNWRLGITRVPILERSLMNDVAMKWYNRTIFEAPLSHGRAAGG